MHPFYLVFFSCILMFIYINKFIYLFKRYFCLFCSVDVGRQTTLIIWMLSLFFIFILRNKSREKMDIRNRRYDCKETIYRRGENSPKTQSIEKSIWNPISHIGLERDTNLHFYIQNLVKR